MSSQSFSLIMVDQKNSPIPDKFCELRTAIKKDFPGRTQSVTVVESVADAANELRRSNKRVDAVSVIHLQPCSFSAFHALATAMAENAGKPWLAIGEDFALVKPIFATAGVEVRHTPFTNKNAVA